MQFGSRQLDLQYVHLPFNNGFRCHAEICQSQKGSWKFMEEPTSSSVYVMVIHALKTNHHPNIPTCSLVFFAAFLVVLFFAATSIQLFTFAQPRSSSLPLTPEEPEPLRRMEAKSCSTNLGELKQTFGGDFGHHFCSCQKHLG